MPLAFLDRFPKKGFAVLISWFKQKGSYEVSGGLDGHFPLWKLRET